MAYYFDHQEEIEKEIEEEQRQIHAKRQEAKPTSMEQRLRAQGLLPPRRAFYPSPAPLSFSHRSRSMPGSLYKDLELIAKSTEPDKWVNVVQHLPF